MEEFNLYDQFIKEPKLRRAIGRKSHFWFFHLYLSRYVTFETAPFHKEMFAVTENNFIKNAVIVAFRGSGKSTIMTLSYPIWAMVGKPNCKFILIISQTQEQARLILTNIKQELETNDLLIKDFGPFDETTDEWRANSLVIPQYGCRISAVSTGESIRGLRHRENRPDLIICDDIEDLSSVKTKEGRDKTFNWFTGEVIPAGHQTTKTIVVGNLLHEDSLIMRLKKLIDDKHFSGIFRSYPLLGLDDSIAWPGKYPDQNSIDEEKIKTGSIVSWQREYLLKIVPAEDQIVRPEWIHYYNELPDIKNSDYRFVATGIDLAISEESTANYTAMVSARVYGTRQDMVIYILPNPVNKRLTFPQTIETAKNLSRGLGAGYITKLFIEQVGYQKALIDELTKEEYPAEGVQVTGQNKRERLSLTTHLVQQGRVLFPKQGAEILINQLLNFGVEKYDDLADAFSLLVIKIIEINSKQPHIRFYSPHDSKPLPIPQGVQTKEMFPKPLVDLHDKNIRKKYENEADRKIMRDALIQSRFW